MIAFPCHTEDSPLGPVLRAYAPVRIETRPAKPPPSPTADPDAPADAECSPLVVDPPRHATRPRAADLRRRARAGNAPPTSPAASAARWLRSRVRSGARGERMPQAFGGGHAAIWMRRGWASGLFGTTTQVHRLSNGQAIVESGR